jgi:hypothetical protein
MEKVTSRLGDAVLLQDFICGQGKASIKRASNQAD